RIAWPAHLIFDGAAEQCANRWPDRWSGWRDDESGEGWHDRLGCGHHNRCEWLRRLERRGCDLSDGRVRYQPPRAWWPVRQPGLSDELVRADEPTQTRIEAHTPVVSQHEVAVEWHTSRELIIRQCIDDAATRRGVWLVE